MRESGLDVHLEGGQVVFAPEEERELHKERIEEDRSGLSCRQLLVSRQRSGGRAPRRPPVEYWERAHVFPEVEHTVVDLLAEILDLELGPLFDAIRADRAALVSQRHGLALAPGKLDPLAVGHELQRSRSISSVL